MPIQVSVNSEPRSPTIQSSLSKSEVEDIREVFDLFDFWDGRDGMIDAVKVGDLLRCSGINPTIAITVKHGATLKQGERLEDSEVDQIVKFIDLKEDMDGNIKYEELIKKVMAGPSTK
ncbi:unnamed protein product [Echinostoma caproni]|uniref:EF-hand domain-containing protein n=1 Tax=Echinostoma caproni TaxID=27848 RepID=A0A183AIQ6_9TREM|nr:unnamed protein product [Echinostoma caproni]